MGRKNVEIRIPARINRAFRAAAGWAEEHDIAMENLGRGLALCALIVIGGTLFGSRLLGRLFHGRRAIVVLGLALAIPVGALAYRFLPDTRTTNATGRGMNESVEENARITKWKRNVKQALTEAGAREPARPQEGARRKTASMRPKRRTSRRKRARRRGSIWAPHENPRRNRRDTRPIYYSQKD
jgi:hypothetical protein